eukprot:4194340-Pyramimonas_sp.AAC.1
MRGGTREVDARVEAKGVGRSGAVSALRARMRSDLLGRRPFGPLPGGGSLGEEWGQRGVRG